MYIVDIFLLLLPLRKCTCLSMRTATWRCPPPPGSGTPPPPPSSPHSSRPGWSDLTSKGYSFTLRHGKSQWALRENQTNSKHLWTKVSGGTVIKICEHLFLGTRGKSWLVTRIGLKCTTIFLPNTEPQSAARSSEHFIVIS